ncbi:M28 family peptidase [Akkermansia sp. BIOML-A14]|nr:M28 family peptidase [Akkermansia sp. BIOML-A67]KAA3149819.1 M28 family peptidase [Akkermansia sp. BIOML-A64]KAA3153284.1 M28 family peptidase [Akkermansia sp. BIOML-A65]KAA3153431.1 M28 family peptidase [Akkermansia sp. BIOML-A62]KAA3164431.1 M28 family peptidase [Akkermansia sp. BIOML-A60]KAA3166156.1 M28 family peptidase [Akkermansia sp. BIOML-A63]KAA3170167.1 M28 family peptidase [Akkermansia sp. BIOML-A58]KAA3174371.1 M28 family peptidase [Akkermansia sp. BIOML-A57]KAA3174530.1 M28 
MKISTIALSASLITIQSHMGTSYTTTQMIATPILSFPVATQNENCYKRTMKFRIFPSLLSAALILSISTGCIISHCTTPGDETAPASTVRPGLERELKKDVRYLAKTCHPRPAGYEKNQAKAVEYIARSLADSGAKVTYQPFSADKRPFVNVSAVFPGKSAKRVIVGAHYDTCGDTPGADDNASGVAGLLALGRMLKGISPQYTIELIAYANEEPPYFATEHMGSAQHARKLYTEQIGVKAMICLEMIGYFSDKENSQTYPGPGMGTLYPDKGNFIAIVGNWNSVRLGRDIQKSMRPFLPTVRLNLPQIKGMCMDFSDHRNFWAKDMPAVMITDTSFFRNPNYHQPGDLPETLDYRRMAQVVCGVHQAVLHLAAEEK